MREWKTPGALLALAGLYFQLVLSVFAPPPAFAAPPSSLPPGYTAISICTGGGMKWVIIDADGIPTEERKSDAESNSCVVCHFTTCKMLPAFARQALDAPVYASLSRLVFFEQTFLRKRRHCCFPESRGPPRRV